MGSIKDRNVTAGIIVRRRRAGGGETRRAARRTHGRLEAFEAEMFVVRAVAGHLTKRVSPKRRGQTESG